MKSLRCRDQPLDVGPPLAQEHVLGAQQADALGAHAPRALGVLRSVCVGPHAQPALIVRMGHDAVHGADQLAGGLVRIDEGLAEPVLEVRHHGARDNRHLAGEDLARGAVDRKDVALLHHDPVVRGHLPCLGVDVERLGTAHRGLAHAARDDRGMRGLAAPAGEDAGSRDHALEIVRIGLAPDEDDLVARAGPFHRRRAVEHDAPHGGTWRGVHALGDLLVGRARSEPREHELAQLVAGHAHQRLVHRDDTLVHELHGNAEGGGGGALAHPRLQHPQLAALDGELDVAQVAVVQLEGVHDLHQLPVGGRIEPLELLQGQGVADARDHVLALRVGEVVAVDARGAGAGVPRERDAGARPLPRVAERHGLHIDRGAQGVRDALLPPVEPRALGVPRVEDRADREVELLARILRELVAGLLAHDGLVDVDESTQGLDREVDVGGHAHARLHLVECVLEVLPVDLEDGLPEHLDEAAVGVPREVLVSRLSRQPRHARVIESDVEDRLHHSRHREPGTRPDGDQQRILGVAEPPAHLLLQPGHVLGDLGAQALRAVPVLEEVAARLGRDREAGGDGKTQPRHLREVGPLAAEQVHLRPIALGEVEDVRARHIGY